MVKAKHKIFVYYMLLRWKKSISLLYLAWLISFWSQTATLSNMDAAGDSGNLETTWAGSQDTQQIDGCYSLSVTPGRIYSTEFTVLYITMP